MLDTLGMFSAAISTHPLQPLAQTLRCAPLAWTHQLAPVPCRGRAPSRPTGDGFRPAPIPVGSERLPPRVGADLCVRPETPPHGTRHGPTHRSAPTDPIGNLHHSPGQRSPAPTGTPEASAPGHRTQGRAPPTNFPILNSQFSIFHSQFLKKLPPPPCGGGGVVFSGRGRRASCPPGSSPRW